jgi:hypothetical protein
MVTTYRRREAEGFASGSLRMDESTALLQLPERVWPMIYGIRNRKAWGGLKLDQYSLQFPSGFETSERRDLFLADTR